MEMRRNGLPQFTRTALQKRRSGARNAWRRATSTGDRERPPLALLAWESLRDPHQSGVNSIRSASRSAVSCRAALSGSASSRADLGQEREQIEIMGVELDLLAFDLHDRAGGDLD